MGISVCCGFCKAQIQEKTLPSLLRKDTFYGLCLNSLKILFFRGLSPVQPWQGRQQGKATAAALFSHTVQVQQHITSQLVHKGSLQQSIFSQEAMHRGKTPAPS